MAFVPINDRHAITEVAFGIVMATPLDAASIQAVIARHADFRDDLPKLEANLNAVGVTITPSGPVFSGGPSATFTSFKRDGSASWRFTLNQLSIAVNCASYTGWADIWPQARRYLQYAVSVPGAADLSASAAALEYTDMFVDREAGDFSAIWDTFKAGSSLLPSAHAGRSGEWHVHQGWFDYDDLVPGSERTLQNLNVTVFEDGSTKLPSAAVQLVHTRQFAEGVSLSKLSSGTGSADGAALIDRIYDALHRQDKAILGSILTADAAKRINLLATS